MMRVTSCYQRWLARGLVVAATLLPLTAPGWAQPAPVTISPPRTESAMDSPGGSTGAPAIWSLTEALAAALQNHPQIQNAQAGVRAAGHGGEAARWGRWPGAQVQSNFGDRYRDSVLVVDQPLWNGGRTSATIDAADARTKVAGTGVAQATQDLAERTADAYLQWVTALDRAKLYLQYTNELERLLGVIERRADASVASSADVQQARVRWEQANAAKLAADGAVISTRLALENLTLSGSQMAALRPQWPDLPRLNAEVAWSQCEAEHPSLLALRAEHTAVKSDGEAKRAAIWPQVSLRYRKPLTRNEEIAGIPNWQLTVQAQSDGALVTQSNWKADAERLIALEQREAATKLQLNTLLRQAVQDEDVGQRQYRASQSAADSAQTLVASAVRQFEVGRRSWLDVLNAVREAHDAQLIALNARLAQNQASARLHAMAQNLPGLAQANRAAVALVQVARPLSGTADTTAPAQALQALGVNTPSSASAER